MREETPKEGIYERFKHDIHAVHKQCFLSQPLVDNPKHRVAYDIAHMEKLMRYYSNPVKLRQEIQQYLKSLPFFEKQLGGLRPFYKGLTTLINQAEYQEAALLISHLSDLSLAKRRADETAELLSEYSLQIEDLRTTIREYAKEVKQYESKLTSQNQSLTEKGQAIMALEEQLRTANLCLAKDDNGLYQEFLKLHQRMDKMEHENKTLYGELKQLTEEKAKLQEERDHYKQLYEDAIAKLKALQDENEDSHSKHSRSLPSSMYFSCHKS